VALSFKFYRITYSPPPPSRCSQEVVISSNVLIHLIKQLLQSLWGLSGEILSSRSWPKTLDHGLNDNFIGHCRRLCPQSQEPSDICLKVFLMVLRALEQSLSYVWLHLKALEIGNQHVLELLPRRDSSWPKIRIPCLGYVSDCHDKGLHHDCGIAPVRRYSCFVTHQKLLWI
jgi:hypothetical protein